MQLSFYNARYESRWKQKLNYGRISVFLPFSSIQTIQIGEMQQAKGSGLQPIEILKPKIDTEHHFDKSKLKVRESEDRKIRQRDGDFKYFYFTGYFQPFQFGTKWSGTWIPDLLL